MQCGISSSRFPPRRNTNFPGLEYAAFSTSLSTVSIPSSQQILADPRFWDSWEASLKQSEFCIEPEITKRRQGATNRLSTYPPHRTIGPKLGLLLSHFRPSTSPPSNNTSILFFIRGNLPTTAWDQATPMDVSPGRVLPSRHFPRYVFLRPLIPPGATP